MKAKKRKVYLDHAASTPVDSSVLEAMKPYFTEKFGNASSLHKWGREAKEALKASRRTIAESINATPREIIFTSGGTESNNFALKSTALTNRKDKSKLGKLLGKRAKREKSPGHIITTKVEHDCVLNSCKWLEKQGFDVTYLDVDAEGVVQIENLEKAIRSDTILVSIIHGNNEIGTIQNLKEIGTLCRKKKVYFHTDACQSYTKVPIDVEEMNIDLMTINAHKIYGPKGIGALYIRNGVKIKPWQHGGGHEFGMRSSTENIPGIVGFAAATQLDSRVEQQLKLQKYTVNRVLKEIPQTSLSGPEPGEKRLCNNINITIKHIEGEALLTLLDDEGIAVSTASACGVHTLEPSHVLIAIGRSHAEANSSIRMAIGRGTTKADVDYTIKKLKAAVKKLRKISPFGK